MSSIQKSFFIHITYASICDTFPFHARKRGTAFPVPLQLNNSSFYNYPAFLSRIGFLISKTVVYTKGTFPFLIEISNPDDYMIPSFLTSCMFCILISLSGFCLSVYFPFVLHRSHYVLILYMYVFLLFRHITHQFHGPSLL